MGIAPKRLKFVAEYAIDLNATQAAIRAGYAPQRAAITGSELLANPEIRALVDDTLRKVDRKVLTELPVTPETTAAVASAAWIVEQAVRVVEMATEAVPVLDKRGNPTGLYQFDGRSAVAALTLLSKRHADFSEKHQVEAVVGVVLKRQTRGLRSGRSED